MTIDVREAIARDVRAVARISAVPVLLDILCQSTGMGFAAVARVDDDTWTACAVLDNIGFGLKAGGQLEVNTTLCIEARAARQPIVIDQASLDPVYRDHHTPRIYGIESYVSVPIIFSSGLYFGNLCAIDPRPAHVSGLHTLSMFNSYAALIARQLEIEMQSELTEVALRDERERSELREQFIAVLGHDLRNPLAAVTAMGEVLIRRGVASDPEAVGRRIRASTGRMTRLIDDVLDFARGRLGAGIVLQSMEDAHLGAALREAVTELCEAHPSHTVIEEIVVSRVVLADRGRLQQLLSNLLGNALHHGAIEFPIHVRVGLENDGLVISVSNRGTPIPLAYQQKIFQPYWRPPQHQAAGGLGLGLYICMQIVRAHGGTLEVASTAAEGTCFVARLPLTAY